MATVILTFAATGAAQAVLVNGATAELDMRATITLSNGAQMTFCPGYGMTGADTYVFTDIGGTIEEDWEYLGTWPDASCSWSASADTSYGAANGAVTVNTAGFDYSIRADAMVEDLDVGDYGIALSDGCGWADWLQSTAAGKTTITIDYTYTLDTRDTSDDAEAYVYMSASFADHADANRLTVQGDWTIGCSGNPNTTFVEYCDSIDAGEYLTVTDGVSWEIDVPSVAHPNDCWSWWVWGEAGVELAPVPEPSALVVWGLLAAGGITVGWWQRHKAV